MAKRLVTYTQKNNEDDIEYICNSDADWSPLPIEKAIFDIDEGIHSYVVAAQNGSDATIHVVNGPHGKFLRTNHDVTETNNLDNLDSVLVGRLPIYLNDYPDNRKSDWSDNLQGVTHSPDHWFFTQKTKLYKFQVSTDLKSNKNRAVAIAQMPPELGDIGCDHFGDCDYFEVKGQGYIFVPVEGKKHSCSREPRLAVFRDDEQLTFIGAQFLPRQNLQNRSPKAGWCAFSPVDKLLYSSHNKITEEFPVYRYEIELDALEENSVRLEPVSDLILFGDNGSLVNIGEFIQGGCFSPEGILYICNGKKFDNESDGGIRAFLPSGEFLYKSSTTRLPFQYKYNSDVVHRQEPEGVAYWDLDSLPAGVEAPNISGQLHAVLLNNDAGDDAIFFKHYEIPSIGD